MNKIIILITVTILTTAFSGCKSFRTYFNPPPKTDKNLNTEVSATKANLTPDQQRKRDLNNQVFKLKPESKGTKTHLNSSLNDAERQYIDNYYKAHDREKKRSIFKLF